VCNIPFEPIATRELQFVSGDGKRASISVTLGKPVRASQDWTCSYRISVFDQTVERAIVGVDSMQALILALHVLPAELHGLERQYGGRIVDEPDLGLLRACKTVLTS
jgi:hypothetical protein